jgi:manganese/zinc/iron transport system permease protein
MQTVEKAFLDIMLLFFSHEELLNFFGSSRNVAIIIGALIAISGGLLGTFLLLRKMSLTSDAISHTVLLGIVVAFLVLTRGFEQPPDLNSPWLILGATASGVLTVWLTELFFKSGLVKEDAALGLVFTFMFAIAVIIINQSVEDVHLDQDAIWTGEIGAAFGKTSEYCYENCEPVVITEDHPAADTGRQCVNCGNEGNAPRNCRDERAVCEEYCFNCGEYSASIAYEQGLSDVKPVTILFPKAITSMGLITLLNVLFVLLLYKELKLATFDEALAATLGFRPVLLHYLLMTFVSITAVGAFDSVGAILVVAFFIVPAATAYLLTDRLWQMLGIAAIVGTLAVYLGYDLSRGDLPFYENAVDDFLNLLDRTIGIGGYTQWDASPSASMVMMMGTLFTITWIISPRYGLVSSILRRWSQRREFAEQMVLVHLSNHVEDALEESRVSSLPDHLNWSSNRVQRVVQRLRLRNLVKVEGEDLLVLTPRGLERVERFLRA